MSLKHLLTANSIAAPTGTNPDRHKAILLSSIGIRSLGVVRSLYDPDDPDTKSFNELLMLIRKHDGTPPTKSIEDRNSEAKQSESESIDEVLSRLRDLSIDCQYNAAVLKERICKQFINGVRIDELKRKLLEAEDEDLDKLLKQARTYKQVDRDVSLSHLPVSPSSQSSDSHLIEKHNLPVAYSQRNSSSRCHRCGGTNHDGANC